jgi:hypothetical protein
VRCTLRQASLNTYRLKSISGKWISQKFRKPFPIEWGRQEALFLIPLSARPRSLRYGRRALPSLSAAIKPALVAHPLWKWHAVAIASARFCTRPGSDGAEE